MSTGLNSQLQAMGRLATAPAHLTKQERMVLYALTIGLRPERVLEIGTLHGGSAQVICAGLDDVDRGRMVCVDPAPQVSPETWALVEHRSQLIAGPSPGALAEAVGLAGGRFDFAFIDGDHSREGVERDLDGILDVVADEAYLVLHDAFHATVREGIDAVLARAGGRLSDAGLVANEPTIDPNGYWWGGLRMLRFRRA